MIAVETYVFTVDAHDLGLVIIGFAIGLAVMLAVVQLAEWMENR